MQTSCYSRRSRTPSAVHRDREPVGP